MSSWSEAAGASLTGPWRSSTSCSWRSSQSIMWKWIELTADSARSTILTQTVVKSTQVGAGTYQKVKAVGHGLVAVEGLSAPNPRLWAAGGDQWRFSPTWSNWTEEIKEGQAALRWAVQCSLVSSTSQGCRLKKRLRLLPLPLQGLEDPMQVSWGEEPTATIIVCDQKKRGSWSQESKVTLLISNFWTQKQCLWPVCLCISSEDSLRSSHWVQSRAMASAVLPYHDPKIKCWYKSAMSRDSCS